MVKGRHNRVQESRGERNIDRLIADQLLVLAAAGIPNLTNWAKQFTDVELRAAILDGTVARASQKAAGASKGNVAQRANLMRRRSEVRHLWPVEGLPKPPKPGNV